MDQPSALNMSPSDTPFSSRRPTASGSLSACVSIGFEAGILGERSNEFSALSNVSFTVERGQTVGIVGRNCSGKSTLLQIICGTLRPTVGQVSIVDMCNSARHLF